MRITSFLYILFYLTNKCLNYVVYPLKTTDQLDTIDKYLSFDSTYTTLEVGTPPQKVNFYLTLNHYKMFITNIQCKSNNLFNLEKSKTFKILGELNQYEEKDTNKNIIVVIDTIYFYNNINLSEKLKMEDYLIYFSIDNSKEKENVCGDIGLSQIQLEKNDRIPEEFEYYLKYLRTQNSYFSFFNYKGEDYIVNSIFLHEEFKDIFYNVKNISWTNPIIKENSLHWEISIKEIFYNKIHFKNKIIFELNLLFELIIGTNEYKTNIQKDFFNSYIDKKICSITKIKAYEVFECNANKFTNKDIQNFPNLYIYNVDVNHIFDLNGKELFNKLNNKYYFNIEIEENFFTKNATYYIIIFVIGAVFTCVGLYIGKKLFFPKYKKAKELTDDDGYYEYDEKGNKEKIKNSTKNKNYTSIEMNSKLENS